MLEKWVDEKLSEQQIPVGSDEYKAKYRELEDMANRCLHVMYGETKSYYEEYKETK